MLDYKPREELIALIQRQESELAKLHDENEALKAEREVMALQLVARQPLADSFVAPGVTVDTLTRYGAGESDPEVKQRPTGEFVLYDDALAHTARAVAAAEKDGYVRGYAKASLEGQHRRECVPEPEAQPVAGELPPLPAGWRTALEGLMDFAPTNRGPLPGMTRGGAYVRKDDVVEALSSLPVQQPAPDFSQDYTNGYTVGHADGYASAQRRAPAAGVQGDVVAHQVKDGMDWITVAKEQYDRCNPQYRRELVVAATVQPDSGRDAALIKELRDRRGAMNASGLASRSDVEFLERVERALAAHPAPSSDAGAALFMKAEPASSVPNCRNQDGICACRSGGSFGGCALERAAPTPPTTGEA